LAIQQKLSKWRLSFVLGISLGLIVDEFQYLVIFDDTQDPSLVFPLAFFGILSLAWFVERMYWINKTAQAPSYLQATLPSVSVVIPAYNEEKFIGKTLRSIARQDYPGKFEVIVVDNGSSDKTGAIAKKFGAKIIYEPKRGVQFARQRGFEAARGEFIASTDADNILPRDWLSRLVRDLIADKEAVAVGGWFYHKKGSLFAKMMINYFSILALLLYTGILRQKILIGQNFIVRKDAFMKCGGFPDFTEMDEDLILAKRLSKIGRVKFHFGREWRVLTSPRKWNIGLFFAALPYILNALSLAILNGVLFTKLSNVREEKTAGLNWKTSIVYLFVIALVGVILFASMPSPIHAKIAFVAKNIDKRILLHHYVHPRH
jgi:glycosyltransferase involved in cell wall biosynthesis